MSLTEEQRKDVIGICLRMLRGEASFFTSRQNRDAALETLRAMIDSSSEHIREPPKMVGFDLEKVREAVHILENFAFASGKITAGQIQDVLWGARLLATSAAEIERLRASLVEHEEHENQTHGTR